MTPITLPRNAAGERDRVRCWRLEELIRSGYAPHEALFLSGDPEVDLHLAVQLLARGCSRETALRILL
jgi:hypothetical protein